MPFRIQHKTTDTLQKWQKDDLSFLKSNFETQKIASLELEEHVKHKYCSFILLGLVSCSWRIVESVFFVFFIFWNWCLKRSQKKSEKKKEKEKEKKKEKQHCINHLLSYAQHCKFCNVLNFLEKPVSPAAKRNKRIENKDKSRRNKHCFGFDCLTTVDRQISDWYRQKIAESFLFLLFAKDRKIKKKLCQLTFQSQTSSDHAFVFWLLKTLRRQRCPVLKDYLLVCDFLSQHQAFKPLIWKPSNWNLKQERIQMKKIKFCWNDCYRVLLVILPHDRYYPHAFWKTLYGFSNFGQPLNRLILYEKDLLEVVMKAIHQHVTHLFSRLKFAKTYSSSLNLKRKKLVLVSSDKRKDFQKQKQKQIQIRLPNLKKMQRAVAEMRFGVAGVSFTSRIDWSEKVWQLFLGKEMPPLVDLEPLARFRISFDLDPKKENEKEDNHPKKSRGEVQKSAEWISKKKWIATLDGSCPIATRLVLKHFSEWISEKKWMYDFNCRTRYIQHRYHTTRWREQFRENVFKDGPNRAATQQFLLNVLTSNPYPGVAQSLRFLATEFRGARKVLCLPPSQNAAFTQQSAYDGLNISTFTGAFPETQVCAIVGENSTLLTCEGGENITIRFCSTFSGADRGGFNINSQSGKLTFLTSAETKKQPLFPLLTGWKGALIRKEITRREHADRLYEQLEFEYTPCLVEMELYKDAGLFAVEKEGIKMRTNLYKATRILLLNNLQQCHAKNCARVAFWLFQDNWKYCSGHLLTLMNYFSSGSILENFSSQIHQLILDYASFYTSILQLDEKSSDFETVPDCLSFVYFSEIKKDQVYFLESFNPRIGDCDTEGHYFFWSAEDALYYCFHGWRETFIQTEQTQPSPGFFKKVKNLLDKVTKPDLGVPSFLFEENKGFELFKNQPYLVSPTGLLEAWVKFESNDKSKTQKNETNCLTKKDIEDKEEWKKKDDEQKGKAELKVNEGDNKKHTKQDETKQDETSGASRGDGNSNALQVLSLPLSITRFTSSFDSSWLSSPSISSSSTPTLCLLSSTSTLFSSSLPISSFSSWSSASSSSLPISSSFSSWSSASSSSLPISSSSSWSSSTWSSTSSSSLPISSSSSSWSSASSSSFAISSSSSWSSTSSSLPISSSSSWSSTSSSLPISSSSSWSSTSSSSSSATFSSWSSNVSSTPVDPVFDSVLDSFTKDWY